MFSKVVHKCWWNISWSIENFRKSCHRMISYFCAQIGWLANIVRQNKAVMWQNSAQFQSERMLVKLNGNFFCQMMRTSDFLLGKKIGRSHMFVIFRWNQVTSFCWWWQSGFSLSPIFFRFHLRLCQILVIYTLETM